MVDKHAALKTPLRWSATVCLSAQSRSELMWWLDQVHHYNGRTMVRVRPQFRVTHDASPWGWGAILEEMPTSAHSRRRPLSGMMQTQGLLTSVEQK